MSSIRDDWQREKDRKANWPVALAGILLMIAIGAVATVGTVMIMLMIAGSR